MVDLKTTTVFTGTEKEIVPTQHTVYQAFHAHFAAVSLISRYGVPEIHPKSQTVLLNLELSHPRGCTFE